MKRSGWLALGVLGLLIGTTFRLQNLAQDRSDTGPAYSIETHRLTDGLWFLYRAAQSAGLHVTAFRQPPDLLNHTTARLVIWQPQDLTQADWRAVQRWVNEGGVLVLSLQPWVVGPNALSVPQALNLPPLADTVRYSHPSDLMTAAPQPRLNPGRPLEPPTYRLAVPYLTDNTGGAQVVGWPLGKGFVWQVANPEWFTGQTLTQHPDNLALALALLAPPPGGQVAFDEYHHGNKAAADWYQVLRPNLTFALVELILAFGLTLWALGGRLGRPLVVPVWEQRESREYLTALAGLLRQAKGGPRALAWTRRRVLGTLRRRLGVGPQEDDAVLAQRYARQTGREPAAILLLLRATAQPTRLTDAELQRHTAALQELLHVARPARAGAKGDAR